MTSPLGVPAALVPLLTLLLAALLVFGAVFSGEFVVDDKLWASADAQTSGYQSILQATGDWVFRPLHSAFIKLAQFFLGTNVAAWHGLSIALHTLNGYLLYLLLRRLVPELSVLAASLLALVFVVHPAGSEAVLWISAMSELTVAFSLLVSFHFYLRWRESWTAVRLASIAVMVLLACLFKETAIVFPVAILLFELAAGNKWRRCLMPFSAMLLAVLLFLLLRQWALGSASGGQPLSFNLARVLELALAQLRFLWLPAAPPFALRPPEVALTSTTTVGVALLVLSAVLFAAYQLKASRELVVLGLAWGALMLWPAYAVAVVGEGFFNGRQAYLPSVAIPILLAALWPRLPSGRVAAAGTGLMFGLLGWMAYSTAASALVWRTNIGVYSQSMEASPGAAAPRAAIAESLASAGKIDQAVVMYAGAVARAAKPTEQAGYLYEMGRLLGQAGRIAESNRYLGQAIELDPGHSHALTGLGNNAWIAGRMGEAEYFYRRAISANPGNVEAISNLQRLRSAR